MKMTFHEAVNLAVEHSLETTADLLRDHGATDEEVEAQLTIQRAELAAWRVQAEAEARRWFSDMSAPSVKLQ